MKHSTKEYDRCLICGRKLKNPKFRKRGYGNICYKKYLLRKGTKPLFEMDK